MALSERGLVPLATLEAQGFSRTSRLEWEEES